MEGEIGRFRRNFLVPVPRVASLADLNARLAEDDLKDAGRHIEFRRNTVAADFAAEAPLLRPLPADGFDTGTALWPRADKFARISVGKCRYSVPARLIGTAVRVRLTANELHVFDGLGDGGGAPAAGRVRGRAPGAGPLPGDPGAQAGRAARLGAARAGAGRRVVHGGARGPVGAGAPEAGRRGRDAGADRGAAAAPAAAGRVGGSRDRGRAEGRDLLPGRGRGRGPPARRRRGPARPGGAARGGPAPVAGGGHHAAAPDRAAAGRLPARPGHLRL